MAGLLGNFKNPLASGGLLSDPMVRLQMGAAMMGGRTLGEQFGGGLQAAGVAGQARQEKMAEQAKINQTLKFLQGSNPELAQAVEAGVLDPASAYKMHIESMTPKTPEFTSEQRNLEWRAQQAGLQQGTPEYQKFMLMGGGGGGGVTVNNEGTIPAGYRAVRDAEGRVISVEPLPGSPAYADAAAAQNKQSLARTGKETAATVVTDDIDRIFQTMDNATLPTTGMIGSALSGVGGTASRDVAGLTNTIKANASFDKLQQMRESSPTGGALGAVSDTEMGLLSSAIGNLEQSQSEGQFRDNLARIQNIYLDIIHGPNAGPPRRKLAYKRNEIPGITAQPPAQMPAPTGTRKTQSGVTWGP